jgi:uridylate kinase
MIKKIKYRRILLKLTGELFGGNSKKGLDFTAISKLSAYLYSLKEKTSVQMVIVVGAGNFFRGRDVKGTNIDQSTADYIGMLGTIMNALALQEELEKFGVITRVMSPLLVTAVCEAFIRRKAIRHLEKGRVVIIGGGTGNPFFTTDSAAALKALELNCNIILKGSNVDGVYTSLPLICNFHI